MEKPQRLYKNRPPAIQTCPLVVKRKTKLEQRFEKEYPFVKWTLHDLSIRFAIPIYVLKPVFADKEEVLRLIYKTPIELNI